MIAVHFAEVKLQQQSTLEHQSKRQSNKLGIGSVDYGSDRSLNDDHASVVNGDEGQ